MRALAAALFLAVVAWAPLAAAAERVVKDMQDMDCYLYTPDTIDPAKTYQLLVGVHGAGGNGNGAGGMKGWVDRGDVIVIGPSFVSKGEGPLYQSGDGPSAEKLIRLFEGLKKEYKLRDTMFLHGFSGGSQFVHRFTMNFPAYVCGVSAHSGGSWATDGYGRINPMARQIPFAISCGEKDTQKSWGEAPFTRLEWFRRFDAEIQAGGFCHIGKEWPGVGHSMCAEAWDLTRQCFQLATGLPGASATEEIAISDDWKNRATPRAKPVPKSKAKTKAKPRVTKPKPKPKTGGVSEPVPAMTP
jgi:predicted esterase